MKDRIKILRKELKLTQQQFADQLGVKRNTVAQWETGVNAITEQTIKLICEKYDIRSEWLRDGTGEMFRERTRDEQIEAWVGRTLAEESETFQKTFLGILSSLSVDEWQALQILCEAIKKG